MKGAEFATAAHRGGEEKKRNFSLRWKILPVLPNNVKKKLLRKAAVKAGLGGKQGPLQVMTKVRYGVGRKWAEFTRNRGGVDEDEKWHKISRSVFA